MFVETRSWERESNKRESEKVKKAVTPKAAHL
jgi:hypothetical protein